MLLKCSLPVWFHVRGERQRMLSRRQGEPGMGNRRIEMQVAESKGSSSDD